jgi:acyl-CoA oxidase
MAPTPSWVKDLKPAGPQGTELLSQERAKSNVNVKALSTFLHTQEGIDRKRTILKILQQVKHSWTDTDKQVANELISEPGPYGLHESMFLVCLCDEARGFRQLLTSYTDHPP